MPTCNVKQLNYNTNPTNSTIVRGISSLLYDTLHKIRSGTDEFLDNIVNANVDNFRRPSLAQNNNVFMRALMDINLSQKQHTLATIGNDAPYRGVSDNLRGDVLKPTYTNGNNYLDFVQKLPSLEAQGSLTTRVNNWRQEDAPINLYPDELGSLSTGQMALDLENGYKNTGEASYNVWDVGCEENSILYKTKMLFQQQKINTLISRFGTSADYTSPVYYNGQVGSQYGESRGRNLLTKEAETQFKGGYSINGYKNPYCRVWTHHYAYDRFYKTMRPFTEIDSDDGRGGFKSVLNLKKTNSWKSIDNKWGADGKGWRAENSGYDKSVMSDGMLNIAPMKSESGKGSIHPRQCMFSIENLAWKDYNPYSFETALSWEQRGPNGGRIMWFPPYGLTFNESTSTEWQSNSFIGRGEQVYTYSNTNRTGNLSFYLIVDHPSIIDYVFGSHNNDLSSNITDNDVHRYFAGCDRDTLVEATKPTPLTDEYKLQDITQAVNIIDQTETNNEITGEGNELVITCYFPNNYSGVDDNISFKSNDDDVVDFVCYMLFGVQAGEDEKGNIDKSSNFKKIITFTSEQRGYERSVNLSNSNDNDKYIIQNTKDTNKYWYYRVDKNLRGQKNKSLNQKEINTNQLNSTTEENKYSFWDFCMAGLCNKGDEISRYMFTTNYLGEDSTELSRLFDDINNEKIYIESIKCVGYSSKSGSADNNEILAKNRANTLNILITELIGDVMNKNNITIETTVQPSNGEGGDNVNDLEEKQNRRAEIRIKLCEKVAKEISTEDEQGKIQFVKQPDKITIENKEYDKYKNIKDGSLWYNPNNDEETTIANLIKYIPDNIDSTQGKRVKEVVNRNNENNTIRYDQEYYFLKKLSIQDKTVFEKLTKKLQYFDPAFHSMTPEGFNGRLTFLNQCMRQGDTIDSTNQVAKNLAFGRPPFCILRLGDFYNQMIIINSLSIDYGHSGDVVWDLNAEGIGVQPLLAYVQLSITFIGGSDLGGAVRRLQNAMSFNYYANTRLYDNRADRINTDINDQTGKAEINNESSYIHSVSQNSENEAFIIEEKKNK